MLNPGMNTTIEGSPADTATARQFVAAAGGDVASSHTWAAVFPRQPRLGMIDAATPDLRWIWRRDWSHSVRMSTDMDATAAGGASVRSLTSATPTRGSILGTAESLGLTAHRTMYVAAAGAGVGVDDRSDWHNRNPHVIPFSMTAPGDLIQAVRDPRGPHGADPDEMAGVIPLATGYYDDGRLMSGRQAHAGVLNSPSDSWRNILA